MFEKYEKKIRHFVTETIGEHQNFWHKDPPFCETCGCVVARKMCVDGKKEVRERQEHCGWGVSKTGYYVYTPHYCRTHAPKTEGL